MPAHGVGAVGRRRRQEGWRRLGNKVKESELYDVLGVETDALNRGGSTARARACIAHKLGEFFAYLCGAQISVGGVVDAVSLLR